MVAILTALLWFFIVVIVYTAIEMFCKWLLGGAFAIYIIFRVVAKYAVPILIVIGVLVKKGILG